MMLHIPRLLDKTDVQQIIKQLRNTDEWIEGKTTAGDQARHNKHNMQLNKNTALYEKIAPFIKQSMNTNALVQSFTLPEHILPPLFNCYQNGGYYGNHVDNALQWSTSLKRAIRTDISMTLFLSEPDDYTGGELIIEDSYGSHSVKLDAGDAIFYPATSLHRVEAVTQGQRLAACSWLQSMVKDDWQRSMLFNLDMTIIELKQQIGENEQTLALTHHYHNLLRQWSTI